MLLWLYMNTNLETEEAPKDLQQVAFNQLERPQKTFFYQRNNGDVFACYEAEAALYGKFHKQLGVSNGQAYFDFIKNSGIKKGQRISVEKAQEILNGAFQAELAVAAGKFQRPKEHNVHFDNSFPEEQRASFVPPR